MPQPAKASVEELTAAYDQTPNVWRVAERFGMCGQSVHERLKKAGVINPKRVFTNAERLVLIARYADHADNGTLSILAKEMGRTKHFICRQANDLGLTDWERVGNFVNPNLFQEWGANNPHPRGMLGKRHDWTIEEIAARTRKMQDTMMERYGKLVPDTDSQRSWKSGWREVAGRRVFFRSSWEANYGRYLQWLKEHSAIAEWEHEPQVFWFNKIKRGTRSYLPDFRVTELNGEIAYHEVKGWMDQRSRTKIKRMRIYHGKVKLIVIPRKTYKMIEGQVGRMIEGWEWSK
ncbi:MAG TPA: hypothetical protein VNU68_35270 [Verrucomicrobiae bacterium]|nr:hypothetical protein [Verrucomicrobiae bacterium]